jgi:hypothetical protein
MLKWDGGRWVIHTSNRDVALLELLVERRKARTLIRQFKEELELYMAREEENGFWGSISDTVPDQLIAEAKAWLEDKWTGYGASTI